MWVPAGKRGLLVKLPYESGNRAANPKWLKGVLGDRIKLERGPNGTWMLARGHADQLALAMRDRFGPNQVVIVKDVGTGAVCSSSCSTADPATAWSCECSCGGRNHGGAGGWLEMDDVAVDTETHRYVWRLAT
jgi:hypothetical protein